ncbi:MAG: polyribonucleotide nucleotidyltransferase, partial [Gemmatimonadetes bacterium]|nr:polyribonucleotide nucleotidyltransferase [Gemmatimonadota bacterium]
GKIAKQANGSITARLGDTVALITAVATHQPVEDRGFFPLMVEYRERSYAAGKIPGGFFKRESRPADRETLTARLIDRPIRPLFPKGFMHEVQVIATVLSSDQENSADMLALNGASAALAISSIPTEKTIAAVRVGRIDGKFILFPTLQQREESDCDLIIACARDAIVMVEGGAQELPEDTMIEALALAQDEAIKIIDAIEELRSKVGKEKWTVAKDEARETIASTIKEKYGSRIREANGNPDKAGRRDMITALKADVHADLGEKFPDMKVQISSELDHAMGDDARSIILNGDKRLDGRAMNEIRDISCEVGTLPRTHGSALFTRGQTQALATITLGTSADEQRVDDIEQEIKKKFMLHYNFPPFSVDEVRFLRGPGRREIGHGALAERALTPLIPAEEDFPYTIRIVSDIMESNGSSSMASICGGSLALMDAGVPIKKPVAGIAMGLISGEGKVRVLSDILGSEDHYGDMDFKVAGTRDGITAFQMDCKVAGIGFDVIKQALEQARDGRLHILGKMDEAMTKPREEMSPYAPRITAITIDPDKIRDIIGPGGKMIRKITEATGATIDIEDDGTIKIASVDGDSSAAAIEMIRMITAEPEIDQVYEGTVRRIVPFGAFIEIIPGKDGLLHISEIEYRRIEQVEDVMSEGDKVRVKVIDIDGDGKIRLSKRALEEPPPGWEDRSKDRGGSRDRGGRDRGGDRGGRGGGGRRRERSA